MKKLFIITALTLLLPEAGLCWKVTDATLAVVAAKNEAGEPAAGLTVTHLADGTCTSESCTDVACSSISPTGMVIVSAAASWSAAYPPGSPTFTVSGCGLTWTNVDTVEYGSRRFLSVSRGVGTWNTTGSLTINPDENDDETFQSTLYSIDSVTGYDVSTPMDAAASDSQSEKATPFNCPDVGTPGTGDVVFSSFGYETQDTGIALSTGITQLAKITNGTGVRSFICGYDDDPADDTPGITYTQGVGAVACIGVVINVSP